MQTYMDNSEFIATRRLDHRTRESHREKGEELPTVVGSPAKWSAHISESHMKHVRAGLVICSHCDCIGVH